MTVRESLERLEEQYLSPYASLSSRTQGRDRPEPLCDIRPEYQRDRDRILHCKSFRRLKHKTQVFLAPEGDHYRTRLTHTLEVSQIARTIAKSLRLNESLAEAIALGHDLGHTPFGHSGEAVLNRIYEGGFTHYEQSIRVVEVLEKNGRGLNLKNPHPAPPPAAPAPPETPFSSPAPPPPTRRSLRQNNPCREWSQYSPQKPAGHTPSGWWNG